MNISNILFTTRRNFTIKRIIDAAQRCFTQRGLSKTSMLHIAQEAAISRTTLYKHYVNLQVVQQAVFAREYQPFLKELQQQLSENAQPAQQIVTMALRLAEHQPGNSHLTNNANNRVQQMAQKAALEVVKLYGRRFIRYQLKQLQQQGLLRKDQSLKQQTAWVLRIVVSLINQPMQNPEHHIAAFLLPALLCR